MEIQLLDDILYQTGAEAITTQFDLIWGNHHTPDIASTILQALHKIGTSTILNAPDQWQTSRVNVNVNV